MKVYRYLPEKELNQILSGDKNVGSFFEHQKDSISNTHHYKKGEKYLHFFKNKNNIAKIKQYYKTVNVNWYICEFDIPIKHLFTHFGIGYYDEWFGYDQIIHKVIEYAVPAKEFNPSWLKSYSLDNSATKDEISR